jgi:hypothetical protein
MQWTAPSEKDTATESLEKRLWDSADQFRANSGLKAQEYSGPILGIIFLRLRRRPLCQATCQARKDLRLIQARQPSGRT